LKAIVFRDRRPAVVDRPAPTPGPGEALVRVGLAGICGTDLEIGRGYLEFDGVPGHEFVGVVESAPDTRWLGRRVVGEINVPCGRCPTCRDLTGRHCPSREVLGIQRRDGAFAERLVLPVANLHEVPAGVPDEAAVFAEPLAAAYEILEQVPVGAGDDIVVLGDGRLGQLCARVLRRAGAAPLVVGRHPGKLAHLARVDIATAREGERIAQGFDLAVEATGSPEGLRRALELVRPRGTIVLKSTYHGEAPIALASAVIDEVTIVGSRCGPFRPALEHLAEAWEEITPLVTARFALDDAPAAIERAGDRDAIKVLLAP